MPRLSSVSHVRAAVTVSNCGSLIAGMPSLPGPPSKISVSGMDVVRVSVRSPSRRKYCASVAGNCAVVCVGAGALGDCEYIQIKSTTKIVTTMTVVILKRRIVVVVREYSLC